jgi:hypothetical protein
MRAAPYLEDAAERSRISVRTRAAADRRRLALGRPGGPRAAIAYLIATQVLGHPRPFFAPVARGHHARPERSPSAAGGRYELAFGVALGIAVGDVLITGSRASARGSCARRDAPRSRGLLFGRSQLLVNQARSPPRWSPHCSRPRGITFARFVGRARRRRHGAGRQRAGPAGSNPSTSCRRAARPVLDELAATLDDVADAPAAARPARRGGGPRARRGDRRAHRALRRRPSGPAHEDPRSRRSAAASRARVVEWARCARSIDLAVRNVRVLARGAIRALRLEENVPRGRRSALRDLADSVRALDGRSTRRDLERRPRPRCARPPRATLVLDRTANMSVSVIVARSARPPRTCSPGRDGPDEAACASALARRARIAARLELLARAPERRPAADRRALERRAAARAGAAALAVRDEAPVWTPPLRIAGARARSSPPQAVELLDDSAPAGGAGQPRLPQRLVGEQVADAGDRALVEQPRLDRRVPRPTAPRKASRETSAASGRRGRSPGRSRAAEPALVAQRQPPPSANSSAKRSQRVGAARRPRSGPPCRGAGRARARRRSRPQELAAAVRAVSAPADSAARDVARRVGRQT